MLALASINKSEHKNELKHRHPKLTSQEKGKINSWTRLFLFLTDSPNVLHSVR